jgi:hypothetical protein
MPDLIVGFLRICSVMSCPICACHYLPFASLLGAKVYSRNDLGVWRNDQDFFDRCRHSFGKICASLNIPINRGKMGLLRQHRQHRLHPACRWAANRLEEPGPSWIPHR